MRDIKFRAWDKRTNTMIKNPITLQHKKGGCTIPNEYLYGKTPLIYFFGTSILLMEYIGKKDKNGVEIYEDDIVLIEGSPYHIKYCDHSGVLAFHPINNKGEHHCHYYGEFYNDKSEVIGNIYENPELLEDKIDNSRKIIDELGSIDYVFTPNDDFWD